MTGAGRKRKWATAALPLALAACNPAPGGALGEATGNDAAQLDEAANALEAKAVAMVRAATEATENAMGESGNLTQEAREDMPAAGR